MRVNEFLRDLEMYLKGRVPDDVIRDQLSYYEEYSRQRTEGGLSEEEVTFRLGEPSYIARTIIDSRRGMDPGFEPHEEYTSPYQAEYAGESKPEKEEKKSSYSGYFGPGYSKPKQSAPGYEVNPDEEEQKKKKEEQNHKAFKIALGVILFLVFGMPLLSFLQGAGKLVIFFVILMIISKRKKS